METHIKDILLHDGVEDDADERVEEDREDVLDAVRVPSDPRSF